MDDDERQEILQHLKVTDENNHNVIETVNKQIQINLHFNDTLNLLKNNIEEDRKRIQAAFNEIKTRNSEIVRYLLYLDQMQKIRYLENRLNQIQDNISAARHKILHPSILTANEIERYNIDFYKLKLLKLGIMKYEKSKLIIAIKIPTNFIKTYVKAIVPIPNKEFMEINTDIEHVVEIANNVYSYEEETDLKNLKKTQNCVYYQNCMLKYNNKFEILAMDDETLIVKNAINETVLQNCDDRKITLNKNYLISVYNCKITIKEYVLQNKIEIVKEKYYIPVNNENNTFEKEINLKKIDIGKF